MIRLVFLLRRKASLSLAEFQRYWREEHGPLVAGHAGHLGVLRYTQSHRLEDEMNERMQQARDGMEPEYDGVAELWWDSEAVLASALTTTSGTAAATALLEDEHRFIDLPESPLWLSHEYPQVNPTPENIVARERSGIVKLHFPLRFRNDLAPEEARLYWHTTHGPLIRSQATASGMLRYQQVHRYASGLEADLRRARGTTVAAYDGHAEVWFDRSLPRTGPEARAASRRAIEDEARFIDFKRSTMWLGKEFVFVDRL